MPRVFNKHRDVVPNSAIYIGRGSKWGNQWSHQEGTTAEYKVNFRSEAIQKHKEYVLKMFDNSSLFRAHLEELRGKDLLCFCSPLACHGDILLELSNR